MGGKKIIILLVIVVLILAIVGGVKILRGKIKEKQNSSIVNDPFNKQQVVVNSTGEKNNKKTDGVGVGISEDDEGEITVDAEAIGGEDDF